VRHRNRHGDIAVAAYERAAPSAALANLQRFDLAPQLGDFGLDILAAELLP
jgi:hypothetical protein